MNPVDTEIIKPLRQSPFHVCLCLVTMIFMLFAGCAEPADNNDDPVLIILDTDMGSDCDDAGALALLHVYADEGKAEILGCIYSSSKVPWGVGVIDAINTAYGKPDLPIGAAGDSIVGDPVDKMNARKLASDTALYGHDLMAIQDAFPHVLLCRRLLASAPDTSVTYITIGHTKGLYDLLVSEADSISELTGSSLVEQKVKRWVALGALGANAEDGFYHRDWNFFFNGTAPYTDTLVDVFPRPVWFVDAGNDVMTGSSLKHTPEDHIVRRAYTYWLGNYGGKTLDDQRPSWDLATIYYAVNGEGDFLHNTGRGRLDFDQEKGCRWFPDSSGRDHYFVKQVPDSDSAFGAYLDECLSRNFRQ